MNKRHLTKKFMTETGADRKTAMYFLRQNQWDFRKAKIMYIAPDALSEFVDKVTNIDWNKVFSELAKAIQNCTNLLGETIQAVDWNKAIKKASQEMEKRKLMTLLKDDIDEEGEQDEQTGRVKDCRTRREDRLQERL